MDEIAILKLFIENKIGQDIVLSKDLTNSTSCND